MPVSSPIAIQRSDIVYPSGISQEQVAQDREGAAEITLEDISLDLLGDRKTLLDSFDHFRRDVNRSGMMQGLDDITRHLQATVERFSR
ncbi:MAG: hypothetical protein AB7U20_21705 [Planctomycetaceae bacterium]